MSPKNIWRWLAVGLVVVLAAMVVLQPVQAAAQEDGRRVKSKVLPTYPELARKLNVGGAVKMQVVISPGGMVKSAKPIGGHPLLIDAAMNAIKKWRYEPAPQETTTVVVFNFSPGS